MNLLARGILARLAFVLFGAAIGLALAAAYPGSVRRLAKGMGLRDWNQAWFYKQMLQFQRRIDACVSDGAVVFVGDSFIQGLCVTEAAKNSVNFGIGGDTTAGVLFRLRSYSSVKRAAAVVIAAGDNDLRRGAASASIHENLRAIRSAVPPSVAVLFCSLTTSTKADESTRAKAEEVNDSLKKLCTERQNSYFVDFRSRICDGRGVVLPEYEELDEGHLNELGYRLCIGELRRNLVFLANLAPHLSDYAN